MVDIQYFGGLPGVGIVPRAPHAGLLREHDLARLDETRAVAEHLSGVRDGLVPPRSSGDV